jgi:hypothetical protein
MKTISVLFILFWSLSINATPASLEKGVWVEINPIQCMGNPWEVDWLKSEQNEYTKYPLYVKAENREKLTVDVITAYYKKQSITILNGKISHWNEAVCEGCDCPVGYTLYLKVNSNDQERMLKLGYKASRDPYAKVWVEINPIQCNQNPWERAWFKNNKGKEESYPHAVDYKNRKAETIRIVTAYYKSQGLTIFKGDMTSGMWATCAGCNCEAGYTLYLYVSAIDESKMLKFGYTSSAFKPNK